MRSIFVLCTLTLSILVGPSTGLAAWQNKPSTKLSVIGEWYSTVISPDELWLRIGPDGSYQKAERLVTKENQVKLIETGRWQLKGSSLILTPLVRGGKNGSYPASQAKVSFAKPRGERVYHPGSLSFDQGQTVYRPAAELAARQLRHELAMNPDETETFKVEYVYSPTPAVLVTVYQLPAETVMERALKYLEKKYQITKKTDKISFFVPNGLKKGG